MENRARGYTGEYPAHTHPSSQWAGTCHPPSSAGSLNETVVQVHLSANNPSRMVFLCSSPLTVRHPHPRMDCRAGVRGLGAGMTALIFCKERLGSELSQHPGSQYPDINRKPCNHSAKKTWGGLGPSAILDSPGHRAPL